MEKIKAVRILRFRYLIGLGLIALLVSGSYLTMQRVISEQAHFARLINLAGHQSGLAHRIAYFSLLMTTSINESDFASARSQVGLTIRKLQNTHDMLLQGSAEDGVAYVMSDDLRTIYFDDSVGLDAAIRRFLDVADEVYRSEFGTLDTDSYAYIYLSTYGPHALEPMLEATVGEYEKLSRASIIRIQNLEQLIWVATLILLVLEAFIIFKPLESRIRDTIHKLHDTVSELESTREQFVAARDKAESASESKSQFLATMSHELRTPMNGVLGMSELLSGTRLDKKQRDYVNIIIDSSESLLTMINDILDYSRLEAGKVGLEKIPFNLEQSIYDVMALITPRCSDKALQLILDYEPDLPRNFVGDPSRMRQILFNLIGNASKFTEEGYIQVSVTTEVDKDGYAHISIHVEDSGIGIAPEKINGLFRSFTQADNSTTRKYGGTGLGLSITRELVDLMGGRIEVDSSPDKGSVFSVTMALKLAEEVDGLPLPDVSGQHVLLLEPNEIYCDLILDRLKRVDVDASVLASAREIRSRLAVIEEHGGAIPVVVVADEAIRDPANDWRKFTDGSLRKPVSWIVLGSGPDDNEEFHLDTERLRSYTTYMQKPFTNHQLYYAVSTSIAQHDEDTEMTIGHFRRSEDGTDFTLSREIKGNILLVEDNLANQKFASLLLSKMGYTADIARDGIDALKLWRENEYDLILMDCLMPNMDGYEATTRIRDEEHAGLRVPIIALTANAADSDREKCQLSGMDEVLTKPYRKNELEDVIERWLGEVAEPSLRKIS
ncbi:MAG: ATP-binding protein [Gammaproteobacteria bacterium]|nr:ATP-binding protein [Gammaproteobacteria bacterium]